MSVEYIKYEDEFFEGWSDKIDNFSCWSHVKSELICGKIGRPIPKITVCIPTYRGSSRVLKKAIESVLAQEGFDDYDIIVSDNYSPGDEELEALMRDFCAKHDNIRYYRTNYDFGAVANWNRSIELAESEWVCQLHHDDVMYPQYLKTTYECAVKYHATLIGVFHNMVSTSKSVDTNYIHSISNSKAILGSLRRKKPFTVNLNDAIIKRVLPETGCLLYNRSAFIDFGGFNGKYGMIGDAMGHYNQIYNGKVVIIPDFLYTRRIEANASLREDVQSNTLSMYYEFGRYYIKKQNKKSENLSLDISTAYAVHGVKSKYLSDFEPKKMLLDMGIQKSIVQMPRKILLLLNSFLLIDLIFRK